MKTWLHASSVLADLAHALEPGHDAEARLRRALATLRRLVPHLAEVVRRTVEDPRSLFARSGVALDVRGDDRPLWMDGDAVRLSQVFGNLLANAARFASPGGRT